MLRTLLCSLSAGALVAGCDELDDPSFIYGESLADIEFIVLDPDQGVHPNASISTHPENPFRFGISIDAKFDAATLGPVPAFYGWAQALVQEPTGEHQYFAAAAAKDIYNFGLADDADLVYARSIAVRGYQNCLNEFADSTATFDVTGNVRSDLLADTIRGLEELGGEVPAGWVLVEQSDGSFVATYNGN
ncbi:MAG: hypothetical protein AAFV53_30930 [Myxococcota bacterium]